MLIGSGGAGKSTLARELGRRTGLPVVHLDALYWQPGWVEPPREEWRATQRKALEGADWIADGNYGGTMEERLPVADLVVLLDYSRWTCLLGVVLRVWRYRRTPRPDMGPGCAERLDLSFMRYVWSYPHKHRPRVLAKVNGYGKNDVLVRLRSRRAARAWLDAMG